MDGAPTAQLRWHLTSEEDRGGLFATEALVERHVGAGEYRGMEFLHVNARSIINGVPASSRMPFRHTINVYRGCSHACSYCFARPTHAYLGLGIGEDFERKIVVKVNAVERLRAELRSPRWAGGRIAMGTNTDPYQRAEGRYHLTRGVVEVLRDAANPFSILTKSTLVLRDLDLLVDAARRTEVRLDVSIGTLDRQVWRLTEPGTPPPDKRVEAVRRLNAAGIACGVLIAPVLPGLSDREDQLREVTRACVDAGAVSLSTVALHLRPGVREHFLGWLGAARPELVPLYRRRFGRGAYQPDDEQLRVAELVSGFAGEAGLDPAARRRGSFVRVRRAPPSAAAPDAQQLRLL
ncbi:MAG TPA: radical SAM protein [Acidimicrobiales bacterium]|nr:radical SAM protein [Acidimicrobiales bacterium]